MILDAELNTPFEFYLMIQVDFADDGRPQENGNNGVLGWEASVDLPEGLIVLSRTLNPSTSINIGSQDNYIVGTGTMVDAVTPVYLVKYLAGFFGEDPPPEDAVISLGPADPASLEGEPLWLEFGSQQLHRFAEAMQNRLVVNCTAEPECGGCAYVRISQAEGDTLVDIGWNPITHATAQPAATAWGGLGWWSESDWNVGVYTQGRAGDSGPCVDGFMGQATETSHVDFLIADFNHLPLDEVFLQFDRVEGATNAFAEFDLSTDEITIGGPPASNAGSWILDVHDVSLVEGHTYEILLHATDYVMMSLFQSDASPHWMDRSEALWSTRTSLRFTAPSTDRYGLVLANEAFDPQAAYQVGLAEVPGCEVLDLASTMIVPASLADPLTYVSLPVTEPRLHGLAVVADSGWQLRYHRDWGTGGACVSPEVYALYPDEVKFLGVNGDGAGLGDFPYSVERLVGSGSARVQMAVAPESMDPFSRYTRAGNDWTLAVFDIPLEGSGFHRLEIDRSSNVRAFELGFAAPWLVGVEGSPFSIYEGGGRRLEVAVVKEDAADGWFSLAYSECVTQDLSPLGVTSLGDEQFVCARFAPPVGSWSALGVRAGHNLRVFRYESPGPYEGCFSGLDVESSGSSGVNVGVVHGRDGDPWYAEVEQPDGSGTDGIELDADARDLLVDGPAVSAPPGSWLVDVLRVQLRASHGYQFDFQPVGDATMLLFPSTDDGSWASRADAVWESAVTGTFTPTASNEYALVVVNDGGNASYELSVSTTTSPPCDFQDLTPGTPLTVTEGLTYASVGPGIGSHWHGVALESTSPWNLAVYANAPGGSGCVSEELAVNDIWDRVLMCDGDQPADATYFVAAERTVGSAAATMEWTMAAEIAVNEGPVGREASSDWVLDVYEVFLSADRTYSLSWTGNGAVVWVYRPSDSQDWLGEAPLDLTFRFLGAGHTPSSSARYGIAVVRREPSASYSLSITSPVPVLVQSFTAVSNENGVRVDWSLPSHVDGLWLGRRNVAAEASDTPGPIERLGPVRGDRGTYQDSQVSLGTTYEYVLGDDAETIMATTRVEVPLWTRGLVLGPPRPNPFNPIVFLDFFAPPGSEVALDVYSISGRLVKVLWRGSGTGRRVGLKWDGTDEDGRGVASGVYVVRGRLRFDGQTAIRTRLVTLTK